MYHDKLVVAVKANGRILREQEDTVFVPFGTEYNLLIKNLGATRCQLDIEIDGSNVVDNGLVVNPGESIELERSIKGGNLSVGNRFKFIERTAGIEAGPRGIKLEDGLIRISFEFEMAREPKKPSNVWPYPAAPDYSHYPPVYNNYTFPYYPSGVRTLDKQEYVSKHIGDNVKGYESFYNGLNGTASTDISGHPGVTVSANSMLRSASNTYTAQVRAQSASTSYVASHATPGITVPGSISSQKFVTVDDIKGDGVKHSMVIKLMGMVAGKPVKKAVTVKHKPTCVTCSKVNRPTAKFCEACGTGLKVV